MKEKENSKKGTLLTLIILAFSFTVGLISIYYVNILLGDKYFYDSYHILDIMQFGFLAEDKSFNSTANFYNLINIFHTYDWVVWSCIINLISIPLIILIYIKRETILTKQLFFWIISSLVLLEIYVLHISKEWVNFLISIIIIKLLTMHSRIKYLYIVTIAGLTGYYFRSYFILIPLIFISVKALRTISFKKKLLCLLIILISIIFILPNSSFDQIFSQREILNLDRLGQIDAQTLINDIIPNINSNRILSLMNYFINIFRLLLPVEILFIGIKVVYFAFAIFILYNTKAIFSNINNYAALDDIEQDIVLWTIAIILVHALFEPDFGSYIRHLISYYVFLHANVVIFMKYRGNRITKSHRVVKRGMTTGLRSPTPKGSD